MSALQFFFLFYLYNIIHLHAITIKIAIKEILRTHVRNYTGRISEPENENLLLLSCFIQLQGEFRSKLCLNSDVC